MNDILVLCLGAVVGAVALLATLLAALFLWYTLATFRQQSQVNKAIASDMRNLYKAVDSIGSAFQAELVKYQHANGVYCWYVVYTEVTLRSPDDQPSVNHTSTIFASNTGSFVPALFAGCMKRVHECTDILIHHWIPLTEDEFKRQCEINDAFVKDPSIFN